MLMEKNSYLKKEAENAYRSYLHAYTTYNLKEVFNIHSLDLKGVGKSFGLVKVPFVELSNNTSIIDLKLGGSKNRKLKMKAKSV